MPVAQANSPLSWLLLSSEGGTMSIGPGVGGIHGWSGGGVGWCTSSFEDSAIKTSEQGL